MDEEKVIENTEKKAEKVSFAPFLIEENRPIGAFELSSKVYQPKPEEKKEKPGFTQTLGATLSGNFLHRKYQAFRNDLLTAREMIEKPEKRFNFLESDYIDLVKPQHYPEVSTAATEGEFFRKVEQINEREKNEETKKEGGNLPWIAGEIINGVTNPFYYAAIGQGVKALSFVPAVRNIFTHSIPSFMLGVGMDEFDQYYNHQTRTAEEAVKNTAIAGIFGGIFGGVAFGARTLKLKTYKSLVTDMVDGKDVKFWMGEKGAVRGFSVTDSSVGAASTRHLELKGESLYGWGENGELHAATPLLWLTGKMFRNPVVRGLTSKSSFVRGFINDSLEHNMDLTMVVKDFKAPPEALQSAINRRQAATLNFQMELADGYYEYLGIDTSKNFLSKFASSKLKNKEGMLNFSEYTKQFYIATVEGGIHENGHIASRSNKFINEYLVPVYDELVELNMLPPNLTPKGAAQHVMRLYDREYITANKNKVSRYLNNKFAETNERIKVERDPINRLENEIAALKEDIKSVTNKETKKELSNRLKPLEERLAALNKNIEEKIKAGKYTDDMIVGDATKGDLRLRSILDEAELKESVNDTINNILGLSEEQMNGQMFEFLSTGTGSTNPFKRRSLMLPDKELIEQGLLIADIRKSFGAYNLRMSRLIEMEKYLRSQGYTPGENKLGFLKSKIRQDYDVLEFSLEKEYGEAIAGKSGKELEKIETQYQKKRLKTESNLKKDVATVEAVYKRLMGETGVKYGGALKTINAIKQFYYSTELGSMALLQLQDAVVPIYRKGFKRYINNGVVPFLRNLAALDFKHNKRLMQEANNMHLACDTVGAFYNMNFAFDRDSFVPLNMFERFSDKAADAMGILNLSNVIGDGFQFIASTCSQSSIIQDIIAHKAGKLEDKWLRALLNLRIDPKSDVADMIVQLANKHGQWKRGSILPNLHLWTAAEGATKEEAALVRRAKELYQSAVIKDVKSVMFTGSNIASYPVGGEPNGMLGAFLMYAGWGLNATANFTIPLFQKFESNRVAAALMMMMVSSVVDPIRKLSQGQELTKEDFEPSMIFKKGLMNSGLLGAYVDMFNKVNSMGDIFPSARLDRFKNTRGLVQFGPERLIFDVANIAGMFANREWNKKDWKRVIKNVPLANLIYLRKAVNDHIDSYNIPETRSKASKLKEWR